MALKHRIGAGAVALSLAGLAFISQHEGKRNVAYPDPAHGWRVPTVCIGHTATVMRGRWYSDAECLALLEKDAAVASAAVLRHAQVPLTQGELDAYTSFVFNVGEGAYRNSTLLRFLNAGDRVAACNQLHRWTYAGGQQLPGLITRRADERKLCLRGL